MLRDLMIRNILLVERLDLEFKPGLNVLTGETGAGKSILLDCLGFVLGRRGRADMTRLDAPSGEVTAIFDGDDPETQAFLSELDLPQSDELILRRVVSGGRKRAFINDRPVSSDALRGLGDRLLEIHGQHDDQGLLDGRSHIGYLDAFAGAQDARAAVGAAWGARRKALAALDEAEAAHKAALADAAFITHALEELDALDPQEGDDEALDAERRLLKAAAAIRDDVAKALGALTGDGAQALVLAAIRRLNKVADQAEGQLDPSLASLERAANELAEAENSVRGALDVLSGDPMRLEAVEDRLFALRALARKHDVQPGDLAALTARFRAKSEAISGGDKTLGALRSAYEGADETYRAAAAALTAKRVAAASGLDVAVMDELQSLKMERAVFSTRVEPGAPSPGGVDQVSFEVATNPGAPSGPLNKIASGGELSRFLLALKVCLQSGDKKTMIFDEIDRGVGGATADAVGRRLASVAASNQVIVVTHSPQVAARGAHHWRVAKRVEGTATFSDVLPLGDQQRVEELARMLAGETISEEAKSAAKVLLAG